MRGRTAGGVPGFRPGAGCRLVRLGGVPGFPIGGGMSARTAGWCAGFSDHGRAALGARQPDVAAESHPVSVPASPSVVRGFGVTSGGPTERPVTPDVPERSCPVVRSGAGDPDVAAESHPVSVRASRSAVRGSEVTSGGTAERPVTPDVAEESRPVVRPRAGDPDVAEESRPVVRPRAGDPDVAEESRPVVRPRAGDPDVAEEPRPVVRRGAGPLRTWRPDQLGSPHPEPPRPAPNGPAAQIRPIRAG